MVCTIGNIKMKGGIKNYPPIVGSLPGYVGSEKNEKADELASTLFLSSFCKRKKNSKLTFKERWQNS